MASIRFVVHSFWAVLYMFDLSHVTIVLLSYRPTELDCFLVSARWSTPVRTTDLRRPMCRNTVLGIHFQLASSSTLLRPTSLYTTWLTAWYVYAEVFGFDYGNILHMKTLV